MILEIIYHYKVNVLFEIETSKLAAIFDISVLRNRFSQTTSILLSTNSFPEVDIHFK